MDENKLNHAFSVKKIQFPLYSTCEGPNLYYGTMKNRSEKSSFFLWRMEAFDFKIRGHVHYILTWSLSLRMKQFLMCFPKAHFSFDGVSEEE